MNKAKRTLALLLLGLLAALWLPLGALAGGATGSITVRMRDTETGVDIPGGSLCCRLVAVAQDEAWVPAKDYSALGLSLDRPADPDLARKLADWAETMSLPGTEQSVGKDGRAVFSGLAEGLYLVTQPTAAKNYSPIAPSWFPCP